MQPTKPQSRVRPLAVSMLALLATAALWGCRRPADTAGDVCPTGMIDARAASTPAATAPGERRTPGPNPSGGGPILAEDRGEPKDAKDGKGGEKPKVCCPAAPKGWKFVYSLESGKSRSTNPEKARCAYRRETDDNDSMTALMDDKNQIVEVRRVLTKQKPPFDVVKTLTDQGAGAPNPNCQICHTLTVVGATPPGHYITNGKDFDKLVKNNPKKQTVTAFDKTGKPAGNRDGLRNNLAPYN